MLRKALAKNLPIIVVVNKVDRPDARITEVVEETYELFLDLLEDADTDVLDFPVVYASAKAGRASLTAPANGEMPDAENLGPLFATILDAVPAPEYEEGAVLQAHVTNLDASPYLGRLALCRVFAGEMKRGQVVAWCKQDGTHPERQAHRDADHRGARPGPGRDRPPGRHHRHRGHPRHHHRRDARPTPRTRSRCR